MEHISKKEVLATTGITYGQLYRWKRQGLIPEAWFHKKAVPTGQETFLPKQQILTRIRAIQELKPGHSLQAMAAILAPHAGGGMYTREHLLELGVNGELFRLMEDSAEAFCYGEAAYLLMLTHAVAHDVLPEYTASRLARTGMPAARQLDTQDASATFFRASGGGYHVVLCGAQLIPAFDEGVSVLAAYTFAEYADMLNRELQHTNLPTNK